MGIETGKKVQQKVWKEDEWTNQALKEILKPRDSSGIMMKK